jgi:aerobic carbon-monoxide dehydrogenase medium subunit
MLLSAVEYARPTSVAEAVRLLSANENARALAGGQTLLNVMKTRMAAPDVLVDLGDLTELARIAADADGGLELGAMATYSQVMTSAEVANARPILAQVCSQIADVQVRNRGTVGGNVCANDPTNHLPPLFVALGASMTIIGGGGERTVTAEDFFLGVYMTAVGPGELLTKVTVPAPAGSGDGFASVTIGRDGTGIVNVAACVNGAPSVAIGCVGAVPVLVRPAATDDGAVRAAVRDASLDPPSDVHGTAGYRRHLAEVLAIRAVREAAARAGKS